MTTEHNVKRRAAKSRQAIAAEPATVEAAALYPDLDTGGRVRPYGVCRGCGEAAPIQDPERWACWMCTAVRTRRD